MTKYFAYGKATLESKTINIIDKNAEYCNWHSYEGVNELDNRFFGKIDLDNVVYDNCSYLGTKSWNKYQADLKTIRKNYDTYVKNIKEAINLIEEFKRTKSNNLKILLEKVLKLMYTYKKKDINYFYQMYKDHYLTYYLFDLYEKELQSLKKNNIFDSLYNIVLKECQEDDDQVVKPKREVKIKTTSYLDINGNMKTLNNNKGKQYIVSDV